MKTQSLLLGSPDRRDREAPALGQRRGCGCVLSLGPRDLEGRPRARDRDRKTETETREGRRETGREGVREGGREGDCS